MIGHDSGVLGAILLPVVQGGRAWVADVNARGGLNGHPVRLVQGDDGNEPARALALAKRMVEEDKVVAFFAEHSPGGSYSAVMPYLEERKIPVIGGCNCALEVTLSPMGFPVGPGANAGQGWGHMAGLLEFSDKRNVSVLYCREAPTCRALRDRVHELAGAAGLKIVHEAPVSLAAPDYTAEVLAARNAGAEGFIAILDDRSVIRLARSAHRQNFDPAISVQWSAHAPQFVTEGGDDVEGVLVSAGVLPWESTKLADFRSALTLYQPGAKLSDLAAFSWVAGKLIEKIATGFSPAPTAADLLGGLYALDGETLGGLLPPTTYLPGHNADRTDMCAVPMQIWNKRFVTKNGGFEWKCAPGWQPVKR